MINFGPATITWESLSVLTNGDFESWSSGNNVAPDNWSTGGAGNYSVARNTTVKYTNNSSAQLLSTANNNSSYGVLQQYIHVALGIDYWKGKNVTFRGHVLCAKNNVAYIQIYDGVGSTYSNRHTGDNNWSPFSITRTIDNNATVVAAFPIVVYNATPSDAYYDNMIAVNGPYNLGKTFGGGSLELYQLDYKGLRSQNITDLVYGGEGIIHMFQWNNTISIAGNSTLNDYGKLTIACNNMTITIDCAKIELGQSFQFGTFNQQPLDIRFSFRKSPDTGNVITFS